MSLPVLYVGLLFGVDTQSGNSEFHDSSIFWLYHLPHVVSIITVLISIMSWKEEKPWRHVRVFTGPGLGVAYDFPTHISCRHPTTCPGRLGRVVKL